jgi:hypothetical protein
MAISISSSLVTFSSKWMPDKLLTIFFLSIYVAEHTKVLDGLVNGQMQGRLVSLIVLVCFVGKIWS